MYVRPPAGRARLLVAGLLVAALTACGDSSGTGESAEQTEPQHDEVAVGAAGDWLGEQLTDGVLSYRTEFGPFTDYGLSIDAALALDALGGHDDTVQQIGEAVAADLDSYISGDAAGDKGSTYAGPTAKALVMAHAAGVEPAEFGNGDLVERLESTVSSAGPVTGRIEDTSTFGDNANVLGQALAAQGLTLAGSDRAQEVTSFLLEQQCSEGYFRLQFTPDKTAPDQSCDAGSAKESAPDLDTTSLVVLALQDVDGAEADDAVTSATRWLVEQQETDGSFAAGGAPNTNSTGVAGWALGAEGEAEGAEQAATWVRGLQAGADGDCEPWDAGDLGAIAYDEAALEAGRKDGITKATTGQWLRATVQALPVLHWAPAAESGSPCGSAS